MTYFVIYKTFSSSIILRSHEYQFPSTSSLFSEHELEYRASTSSPRKMTTALELALCRPLTAQMRT